MLSKFLELVKKYQADIILGIAVILLTYTGYNIGKIVAYDSLKTPITITDSNLLENSEPGRGAALGLSPTPVADLSVVASSKSSGKLYHFKWCPGAGMISPANLLTFPNEAAAISAGFKLAANCDR